jgi:hypothetical protein
MLVVILIIFGICWLPYHAYFILSYYHPVGIYIFCICWLPYHAYFILSY